MSDISTISIGDFSIKTPVAISSMAGITDGAYIKERAQYIGIGFSGGYAIDEKTIKAAGYLETQGRKEFILSDPFTEIENQVKIIEESGVVPAVNIRAADTNALIDLTNHLKKRVIYEIDAHCRQQPMIEAGCGEALLHDTAKLTDYIKALKSTGVIVSVKIRAGLVDDKKLAITIWKAGADIIHVDLMDLGPSGLIAFRNSCPLFIIANNGVTSFEYAKELFSHGADMISLARGSDIKTLKEINSGIEQFYREHGWYNAPKQLCRGGDIRALAFCCMPVKPCPLLPFIQKYGITPQEFVDLKMGGVKGTILEDGNGTCFGSLAYCCKDTTPCMFRNATLHAKGIKRSTYMNAKHELSKKILEYIFHDKPE